MNARLIFGQPLRMACARPELLILLLIISIIAMLVIPLPTYLVDLFIGMNILISLMVFMSSFYVDRILAFSTFPSVLLITTLFRLALSISTSRLILLEADAGKVVESFGRFVIGDSLAVGFVIFAIVTIVQFIVITKGSERVAEVAARFSLDGMPGKQMSIDADQKAGVLDNEGARERRLNLERESQLYGSYDGAMKFIKGDAIAGIVIIFVNLIGGMAVGVLQQGMPLSEALQIYTLLTIGDGLVAQIPALLISISAGFIVTRVSGSGRNLGQSIVQEMFANNFVLGITALLVMAMGWLPGFPLGVFSILGAALGAVCYWKSRRRTDGPDKAGAAPGDGSYRGEGHAEDTDGLTSEALPLLCILSSTHRARWTEAMIEDQFRQRFFFDYGLRMPSMAVRFSDDMEPDRVRLLINEVYAAQFSIAFGAFLVVNPADELFELDLELREFNGEASDRSVWVSSVDVARLTDIGYQTRTDVDELFAQLSGLVLRNITEFFGVQETKNLLDGLERKYPELLKETYRYAPMQRIAEVLQRLLQEQISIRNLKLILESLAQWGGREKDVIALVEHARTALARYISSRFAVAGVLRAVVISPRIEEILRASVRQAQGVSYMNLEPEQKEEIMDLLDTALGNLHFSLKDVVLLTSVDVRRFFKKMIEDRFAELQVLSFGEISDAVSVDVLKTI